MGVLLGIDTGGTFTDAVLVDDGPEGSGSGREIVLASAKAPTRHHDLAAGVDEAVAGVLGAATDVAADAIELVSVSTTLATNALVENHGEPAGLVAIGLTERELERAGIAAVVPEGDRFVCDGGHDAHGNERVPLPEAKIRAAAVAMAPRVTAFAVAAQFGVRNPDHERRAAEIVREATGLPVTASHELSSRLDGPRRALTACLNARLLGTLARLNAAVGEVLSNRGIDAPLMVVRGDGSLVAAEFAAQRPVETVLSGPAASVIGGVHLARVDDALVIDVGGTTTDVAVVTEGRVAIAGQGAVVGGHRTMVEAVDMATVGLGGDSEVRIDTRDQRGPILVGPERAVPLARLAVDFPEVVERLERQLGAPVGLSTHGRFLVATARVEDVVDDARERAVLERLASGPLPFAEAAPKALDAQAALRLRARGRVRVATLTPTDALVVLGGLGGGEARGGSGGVALDGRAAQLGASVLARQTSANGGVLAADGPTLCARVLDGFVRRSAAFVMRTALAADGIEVGETDVLIQAALDHHRGVADVGVRVDRAIVAIGAPAEAHYPAIGERLRADVVVPEHAQVANAVGAVVGRVNVRRSCTITQPTKGQFRVHVDEQPTFGSVDSARAEARARLEAAVMADAANAGAATPELAERWQARTAEVGGKEVFVEGTLILEATARPRL